MKDDALRRWMAAPGPAHTQPYASNYASNLVETASLSTIRLPTLDFYFNDYVTACPERLLQDQ